MPSDAGETRRVGEIRGVLFDSGDTLARPIAGSWWPKQSFIDAFEAHGIEGADMSRFDEAISLGIRYLDDNHSLTTEEEHQQFRTAYTIVIETLGVQSPTGDLLADILRPFEEGTGIEPFEDTRRVLKDISLRGLKLGIVSDNWPSLDRRYRQLGLRDYFDAFVISAVLGCWKPCERMYTTAIDELGIPPEPLMFVDDWPENVAAAVRLGMSGVVISRYGETLETDLPVVTNLDEVVQMIE